MTLHRTANFRVKDLNSDIEQTRMGIILLVLLYRQPILILLYRFSVKNTASRPVQKWFELIGYQKLNVFDI